MGIIATVFRGVFAFFFSLTDLLVILRTNIQRLILILPTLKFGGKLIPAMPFIQY